jgi:polar amino acid transport system substrate-binding protein
VTGTWSSPVASDLVRAVLAPQGRLRVGVFEGSPLSMVTAASGEKRGLGYELGAEFAWRLGVPAEYILFDRIAEVIVAMKRGEVDFALSNATPARAVDVDFSPTVISLELGYLVPAASSLARIDEIDRPGLRVGVTTGSTSERTLPTRFAHARVVAAENSRAAIEMLNGGALDLFATNKPTLYQMSDAMDGARVLPGNWGQEHIAIAIPKGREQGMAVLGAFVTDVQSSGLLERLRERAGLRGAVVAPPPA